MADDDNNLGIEKLRERIARSVVLPIRPNREDKRQDYDNWPELILPGAIATPEIPADILPGLYGDFAAAVAGNTQTPPATAVMAMLSTLATCLQGRFEVNPFDDDEHAEILSFWTLNVLESGNRVTDVMRQINAPLGTWEKLERDRQRSEIARVFSIRAVAKKRIERLTLAAASPKITSEEREKLRAEIQDEQQKMPEEMWPVRLYMGDATPERVEMMLVEQRGRMSVLSDESGMLGIMTGQYSGGRANLDVFLKGYSGSPLRVERAGRNAYVDRPALSLGLRVQSHILADYMNNNPRLRDSGLLARFAYAMPVSNIGQRKVRERQRVNVELRGRYTRAIHGLLDGRSIGEKPRMVGLADDARELWRDFADEFEQKMGDGGCYEAIRDWLLKLPGNVARIAALMALSQDLAAEKVGVDMMERALKLGRLLVPHVEAAFRLAGADQTEMDAMALLRWIKHHQHMSFDRRTAQKGMEGRFRTIERLRAAAARLAEWHVLSSERMRVNRRTRQTPYYEVNPRLWPIVDNLPTS